MKYTIQPTGIRTTDLFKDGLIMARFCGKDHRSDAQKVCDLLNETSRSQGEWPKNK